MVRHQHPACPATGPHCSAPPPALPQAWYCLALTAAVASLSLLTNPAGCGAWLYLLYSICTRSPALRCSYKYPLVGTVHLEKLDAQSSSGPAWGARIWLLLGFHSWWLLAGLGKGQTGSGPLSRPGDWERPTACCCATGSIVTWMFVLCVVRCELSVLMSVLCLVSVVCGPSVCTEMCSSCPCSY